MESRTASIFKKIILAALIALGMFGVATYEYWIKQAGYLLKGDETQTSTPEVIYEYAAPNILAVPRLEIEAPIVYVDQADEEVFQQALQRGVVHYPGTADIGQAGNPYLFGHSSDFIWAKGDYKTVFALLPKIKIGDEIIATDKEGKKFIYRVFETTVVDPDDVYILNQRNYERKLLSLQTSYPIGTALQRFIAICELVENP